MRFYKLYRFQVGKKTDFQNLFELVDSFLAEHGLKYASMGYSLQDIDMESRGIQGSCRKLIAKMPQFEPLVRIQKPYTDILCLSNMDVQDHGCDEASIRTLGSKIPRTYNFFETDIYYRNIHFAGENGSFIRMHRDSTGPQSTLVFMKLQIVDQQTLQLADGYAANLAERLANAKYFGEAGVELDATEQAYYHDIRQQIAPILSEAKVSLKEQVDQVRAAMLLEFPQMEEKNFHHATILRRMGKKYGFDRFTAIAGGPAVISMKVEGSHYLSVEYFRYGGAGLDGGLILSGPGFYYDIVDLSGAPENGKEAEWFLNRILQIVQRFALDFMPQILRYYPEAPVWSPIFLES